VKPDNILFHPDGSAKLADLGLAKRLNDDTGLTSVNQGVGTSYYMPYEQALNASLVDARSDVFALGATLYHLLTGHVPFPGATHEEIVKGKESDRFIPVRAANPDVPEALAAVLERTLHRDPRARFATADEFAAALDATGLATRVPAFAPDHSPTPEGHALDSPTRVDLPAGPPKPTLKLDVPPGSGISVTALVVGELLLLGALGLFARPGFAATADGPPACHARGHAK
jgi:eukaryotic-like serine/threonine-protein kinase